MVRLGCLGTMFYGLKIYFFHGAYLKLGLIRVVKKVYINCFHGKMEAEIEKIFIRRLWL
jgi:hypothetical protein